MKKILRFTASWCQPCKGLAMNLMAADLTMPVETIDIDAYSDVAAEYGIRSVPTMVMLDENIEVKRMSGVMSTAQIKEWAAT